MFKIEKSHPAFPSFRWLLKAVSKDGTRAVLKLVRIEEDPDKPDGFLVVATDGRRLHRLAVPKGALTSDPEPGNWSILKNTASEIVLVPDTNPETEGLAFPNWRAVIPATSPKDPDQVVGAFKAFKNHAVSAFTARCNGLTNENEARKKAGEGLRPQELILFNDAFLSDLLGEGTLFAAKGSQLWSFRTEYLTPAIVESEGPAGVDLLGVLMPLR